METDPHRWISALRQSQNRLTSLVGPLSPEELRGPSYHDWNVAEVLGHMGSQAEIFMGWLDSALDGTEPSGAEVMQPIWDAWNARSLDQQATDSIDVNERLVRRFEALTDDQLDRMHLSLFGMELDGSGLARLRLAEHALHTWDIAVALDRSARLSPDAVALLIDALGLVAGWGGKPQTQRGRVRVRTSDPERDLSLTIGDAVELIEWTGGDADGELQIPAEAFIRLIYGRLDSWNTPPVEITGPIDLDELRQVFQGI